MEIPKELVRMLGMNQQGDLGPLTTYTNKNGKLVVFPRAPPLNPPTPEQKALRQKFASVALLWHAMPRRKKDEWLQLARSARLRMTGYGLFTWWVITHDNTTLETIRRQANDRP